MGITRQDVLQTVPSRKNSINATLSRGRNDINVGLLIITVTVVILQLLKIYYIDSIPPSGYY